MKTVLTELLNKDQAPSMTDIERLLASIGAPGENRDEKVQAVTQLIQAHSIGTNPQGVSLLESLDSYGEF